MVIKLVDKIFKNVKKCGFLLAKSHSKCEPFYDWFGLLGQGEFTKTDLGASIKNTISSTTLELFTLSPSYRGDCIISKR